MVRHGMLALVAAGALVAACGGGSQEPGFTTNREPAATIDAELSDFLVRVDRDSVSPGVVRFTARNTSPTGVHELAVLRVRPNGSFQNTGEIEDLRPGDSGAIVLDLPAGRYELACLIARGESGSTVDHFQAGMHIPFEVR